MVKISRCGQFSVTGTRNLVMGMERHVNKKLYTSTDLQIHFYRTANLGNYIILFYFICFLDHTQQEQGFSGLTPGSLSLKITTARAQGTIWGALD